MADVGVQVAQKNPMYISHLNPYNSSHTPTFQFHRKNMVGNKVLLRRTINLSHIWSVLKFGLPNNCAQSLTLTLTKTYLNTTSKKVNVREIYYHTLYWVQLLANQNLCTNSACLSCPKKFICYTQSISVKVIYYCINIAGYWWVKPLYEKNSTTQRL